MTEDQAAAEAAQAEYLEYQFFHDNALGNFGDLLLYSATSPSQLIYLDNVLNVKGAANENYAREILELFAFGVDNRYTQDRHRAAREMLHRLDRPQGLADQKPVPRLAHARHPPMTASSSRTRRGRPRPRLEIRQGHPGTEPGSGWWRFHGVDPARLQ
jgi:hypothetical protein